MPILSRFLEYLHSRPRWGWTGLLVYAAAVTFPHENVQWLMNEIAIRITHRHLYQLSAAISGGRGHRNYGNGDPAAQRARSALHDGRCSGS